MSFPSFFREEHGHYRALTGVRGLAAMWVLLYHAWVFSTPRLMTLTIGEYTVDFTPFFSIGWAGVPIFFVLSGFLLSLPFAAWQAGQRERPAFGAYMFRRLVRVFPAYYAQLVLLAFILWIQLRQIPITDGAILWRHLLMLFVPPPIGTTPINGVWWTLPIEFSFYLVLPLFAILLRPGRWWLLLGLGLISMWLWRYVSISLLAGQPTPSKMLMAYQLPGSMDSFGLGMLGSVIYVNRVRLGLDRLSSVALSATVLGAIVVIICALYWMHYRHMDYWEHSVLFYAWTPLFCLAVVVLLFAGVSGCRIVNALFANRFMVFLGVISYSVYLWHYPILEWLMRSTLLVGFDGYRLPLLLGTAFVLTLFAASLSYVLIERPFMQLRREKTSRVVPATVL